MLSLHIIYTCRNELTNVANAPVAEAWEGHMTSPTWNFKIRTPQRIVMYNSSKGCHQKVFQRGANRHFWLFLAGQGGRGNSSFWGLHLSKWKNFACHGGHGPPINTKPNINVSCNVVSVKQRLAKRRFYVVYLSGPCQCLAAPLIVATICERASCDRLNHG